MKGRNKKTRRERWGRDGAYLMVRFGRMEKSTYGPRNFYKWSKRARLHFLLKRWPDATGCCNGVPWELPDSHAVHIPAPEKRPHRLRKAA